MDSLASELFCPILNLDLGVAQAGHDINGRAIPQLVVKLGGFPVCWHQQVDRNFRSHGVFHQDEVSYHQHLDQITNFCTTYTEHHICTNEATQQPLAAFEMMMLLELQSII